VTSVIIISHRVETFHGTGTLASMCMQRIRKSYGGYNLNVVIILVDAQGQAVMDACNISETMQETWLLQITN